MDPQSRQEYVRAAISFLQNPKLAESSLKEKLKFLKDKGLSDIEVDEALNLALIQRNQSQSGKWNFLLILGLCISGYKLYQAYLDQQAHRVEGGKTKQKECVGGDQKSLASDKGRQENTELDKNQPTLSDILQKMTELKKLIELQRTNFGAEIQSLKTLMLGHDKFAAPPKIPEWQMPTTKEQPSKELAKEPAKELEKEPEKELVKELAKEKEKEKETASKPESGGKKNKADKGKNKSPEKAKNSSSTNGVIEPTLLADPNPE
jgi:hypothetical protein